MNGQVLDGKPRVMVVGGSIGGLTAGVLLRDAGCDVHIFERSTSPLSSRGAGIVVHPMTVRYLVDNAIVTLDRISVSCESLRYIDAEGATVHEEPAPYRFTAWNTLYRTLRGCLDAERYHLGETMVALSRKPGSVHVLFEGGREESCDLAACFDGVSSTARSLLLEGVEPVYAGYVGWRGTVPESELTATTLRQLERDIVYHVMPHSHILTYPIPSVDGSVEPGHRLINFVWYRNVSGGPELDDLLTDRWGARRDSVPPGALRDDLRTALGKAASDLPAPMREAVERCREPFIQPIVDLEVPRMAFGRACLMGDAAFAARPHAAAGTAKACADAWALAEALAASGGDVAPALEIWEPGQLALGRQLVDRAREMGNRSQFWGTYRPDDLTMRFGLRGPGN